MELGGLEPPTSWVRCGKVVGAEIRRKPPEEPTLIAVRAIPPASDVLRYRRMSADSGTRSPAVSNQSIATLLSDWRGLTRAFTGCHADSPRLQSIASALILERSVSVRRGPGLGGSDADAGRSQHC